MTSWLPPLRGSAQASLHLFALNPGLLSSRFRWPPSRSPKAGAGRELFFVGGLRLQLNIVLNPDLLDQLQLRLDEIDMLLLALRGSR